MRSLLVAKTHLEPKSPTETHSMMTLQCFSFLMYFHGAVGDAANRYVCREERC